MHTSTLTARPGRVATKSGSALSIQVRWGDRAVATQVLSALGGRRFSIGPQGDVATRGASAELRWTHRGPLLAFTSGIEGAVLRNGQTSLALSQVVRDGLADEAGAQWELPLGRSDVVTLTVGALTVTALPVRAPLRVGRASGVVDYLFFNVLLAALLLGGLVVAHSMAQVSDDGALGADLINDGLRLRRVLIKKAEPLPRVVSTDPQGPKQPKEPPAKAGAPAHAIHAPVAVGPPRGTGRDTLHAAMTQLFAGLGAQGVFGAHGLGNELTRAAAGVEAASFGGGGWTPHGDGMGGLVGGPVGIGAVPSMSGHGGGDPRLGPGHKAEHLCDVVNGCGGARPEVETTATVCKADDGGEGCLDKEMIRKVIRQHIGQIRYCYETALTTAPNLKGKLRVRFHVAPGGGVDASDVAESSIPGSELGSCVVGRVRTWRFPGVPYGYTVTYPFLFQRAGP